MSELTKSKEEPCQCPPNRTFSMLTFNRSLESVLKVVREGQMFRAPIERVADLITGYFVPVIVLMAVLTWIVWLVLGYSGSLPDDYLDISIGGWGKSSFMRAKVSS